MQYLAFAPENLPYLTWTLGFIVFITALVIFTVRIVTRETHLWLKELSTSGPQIFGASLAIYIIPSVTIYYLWRWAGSLFTLLYGLAVTAPAIMLIVALVCAGIVNVTSRHSAQ